jgi:sugar phosphate isomerase/epimerase
LPPSRRDLLKRLPILACAGPLFTDAKQGARQEPRIRFPVNARDRLAVTSWPFRAYIESPTNRARNVNVPGMDLKDFPALIAERFGIYNINPLIDHLRSTDPAYLSAFRDAVAKARSHIVDLGLPGRQFYASDPSARESAVDSGRKWIDIAVLVGSPSVRQHIAGRSGEPPQVALAAESLGKLADYGAKQNIVINLENDNAIAEDPFFLVSVIEKVDNPYLRALPDFGNSLMGRDPDYNARAVTAMFKHAFNMCHVKDTVQSNTGQVHTVDLKQMFGIAKTSSYGGFFSMEFDTKAGEPFAGTKKLVEETLKYLS